MLWTTKFVVPIACRETTSELLRVLNYPKFKLDRDERESLLQDYLPYIEIVNLPEPRPMLPVMCRDRDDEVFIQLALVARADFLVSGDGDLTELRDEVPVEIIGLNDFKNLARGKSFRF